MSRAVRLVLCALATTLAQHAGASGIERFHSYLRTTQAARADFEQKVYDKERRLVQSASGSFAFQRPGQFRWMVRAPARQLIVGDGERVWVYDEDLQQVTVRKLGRALGSTPAALLAGNAEVERAFELKEGGERDGLHWLEARPREREAGFERVRIGLSAVGVDAMELVDHFGQTTLLRFANLTRNPPLDASLFSFTPPPGVDVLGER